MTAITFVVGIVLVTIGVLCAIYGVLLCYTTKVNRGSFQK
jgi:hypothetical protein